MRTRNFWLIALGVAAGHAGFLWWVADKHFLPRVARMALPTPPNFAARTVAAIDPADGVEVTKREYLVSTRLRPVPVSDAR